MRDAPDRAAVGGPDAGAMRGAGARTRIPRRRALALGAAAGVGSLLAPLRAAPALAALAPRPRGFGLTVTPADFDGGRTRRGLPARRLGVIGVGGGRRGGGRRRAGGGGGGGGGRPA